MLRGGGGIFQCSFCNIHCCCLAPCVKHCWPLQSWSWGFSHLGDSPPKSAAPEDNCLSKILTKSVTCSHTSFSRREDKRDGTADSLFLKQCSQTLNTCFSKVRLKVCKIQGEERTQRVLLVLTHSSGAQLWLPFFMFWGWTSCGLVPAGGEEVLWLLCSSEARGHRTQKAHSVGRWS